jgi:hypothetical protein
VEIGSFLALFWDDFEEKHGGTEHTEKHGGLKDFNITGYSSSFFILNWILDIGYLKCFLCVLCAYVVKI